MHRILAPFVLLFAGAQLLAGEPSPRQLRVIGPNTLERATRNLVYVEGLNDGKNWERLLPDNFGVKVTGAARLVDDPAGKPMNPFEVQSDDVAKGKVTIEVRAADRTVTRTFGVGAAKAAGVFEAVINVGAASHRFMGLGGGVLFYDNQFDISAKDDMEPQLICATVGSVGRSGRRGGIRWRGRGASGRGASGRGTGNQSHRYQQ